MVSRLLIAATLLLVAVPASAGAADDVKITPDVVYGHKFGLAMTMDVYTPENDQNGTGVLFMVSGGWYSRWTNPESVLRLFQPMLDAGFTVFAVRHGSSPKFSIPEVVSDVRRSVRFVRKNAEKYGVDPERLGVCGMSAGGHLSLVLGTTADTDPPEANDPLAGVSSRVQAVVAYVPPTDLRIMVWDATDSLPAYRQFPALDLDVEEAAKYSPLLFVTPDDAPTLLVVGQKDELVPVKHSQDILAAFKENNVPAELALFEESGHGFSPADLEEAMRRHVAWFTKYLVKQAP
jgi:acetyl esterase/lipase